MITMQEIKDLMVDGVNKFLFETIHEDDPFKDFNFEVIEQFGGEGQGDHCHDVIKFTRKSDPQDYVYVKFDGYYSSYDGCNYSYYEPYIVEPYEKTVRDWRKI
jgi:hypothetical protein